MEKIVRKEEIACNKQFLFFSQHFISYMALIFHFKCTLKCRLQFVSTWTSLNFYSSAYGLTLYQSTKIFSWSKLKRFADNKMNVTQKLKFVFGRVENIVGKGEYVCYNFVVWERFNSLLNNPDFQQPQQRSLLNTLWEMEKMLVTTILSHALHKINFKFVRFILLSACAFSCCFAKI